MAQLDTDLVWAQVGGLQRIEINQGEPLRPNHRNFISPDATVIKWPNPSDMSPGDIFTVYRAAMMSAPTITSSGQNLTIFYDGQAYGAGLGQGDISVTYNRHTETVYCFNGYLIQELPNTDNYDALLAGLNERTYTSSGTFVVPQDNNLRVTLAGGGGGGGQPGAWFYGGGGAAAAGTIIDQPLINIPPGTVLNILIGAGGVSGQNGGDTAIEDLLIAYGGKGAGASSSGVDSSTNHGEANSGLAGSFGGSETIVNGFIGASGGTGGVNEGSFGTAGQAGQSLNGFSGGAGGTPYNKNSAQYPGGGGGGASALADGGYGTGGTGTMGSGAGGKGKGGDGILTIKWGAKGA